MKKSFPVSTKTTSTGKPYFDKKVMPHNSGGDLNKMLKAIKHSGRPAMGGETIK